MVLITSSLLCFPLSHALVQTIARGVFEVIVDQSPFVPEAAMEDLPTKVGGSHLSEEERAGNEVAWRKTFSKKKTGERISLSSLSLF